MYGTMPSLHDDRALASGWCEFASAAQRARLAQDRVYALRHCRSCSIASEWYKLGTYDEDVPLAKPQEIDSQCRMRPTCSP